jgi:tRNA (cytidine/uridine-2'-O-)-methyltransferase
MFDLVLYQPEIPPNTGNIIRVCANTGTRLHLVHPLGFSMDEKALRRAGLDYHEFVDLQEHADLTSCYQALGASGSRRIFAISTRGARSYAEVSFQPNDVFMLGPETRGLPQDVLDDLPAEQILRIPMRPDNRSINLANAAAVLVYEAWRQHGFAGGA